MSQAVQVIPPPSQAPDSGPRLVAEPASAPWFAVRTRSNHERIAVQRLLAKGVDAYLPTLLVRSRRRDRRAVIARPLFPGYFFARFQLDHADRVEVLKAPGVMHLVGFGGGPVSVPEWQVESVRCALESNQSPELLWKLVRGQRVKVVAGALAGAQGVVMADARGSHRLVISIDLLGRSLSVAVSPAELEPVH